MEEKERFEYFFGTNTIKDNKTNQFYGCVVDLLNQQDKRIKELERKILIQLNNNADNVNFMENQRRENKQLKQQLAESETQLKEEIEEKNGIRRALTACNRQNDEFADMIKKLENEKEELKQQLHDLPKKIVDEIRKAIFEECREYYDAEEDGVIQYTEITPKKVNRILDTILKKYGGENESNND